jgi:sugar (pentulose or hexulose) kinase
MSNDLSLGLDFGTSGARACVIDTSGRVVARANALYDLDDWMSWVKALAWLVAELPKSVRHRLGAIAVAGTSGTVLLTDATNRPLAPALLYNDARALAEAERITRVAPAGHVAAMPTSALAKVLWLRTQAGTARARYCTDQASWLAALLTGRPGLMDYHNALKLGYDVETLAWPDWVKSLGIASLLPRVVEPGSSLGMVPLEVAVKLDIPDDCTVRAGTTDSIAAFMAADARETGDGVTSLGSTLALKLLSTRRVEDAASGVYSHRWGRRWLAGGASNSGGAVLRQFFDDRRIASLSEKIDPSRDSGLDYYPLPAPGERFPVNDPQLAPRLSPRPEDDVRFLQGLLEGIARIEAQGYRRLAELGASPVKRVFTTGGGARNAAWTAIRARILGVPVMPARHTEAAFGAARLAQLGASLFE